MRPIATVFILSLSTIYINLVCTTNTSANTINNGSDVFATMSIYYDPRSLEALPMKSIQNNLSSSMDKSTLTKTQLKTPRIGFRSNGCTCHELHCGCCAGFNIQQFNFNREGCMNFTYNPFDFAIEMNMFMNENIVFSNIISGKNPPPFCVPVPMPYLPAVDFCAKLFDVHTPGQNLHMCLDFETRIQRAPVLVLHFDCMRMGSNGLALVKPGDTSALPISTINPSTEIPVTDSDIYDELTEIKYAHQHNG